MFDIFGHEYPYQNAHELNLDWLLKEIKRLGHTVEEFIAINKITYKGVWDITKQYPTDSIVTDGDGKGWISKKPVPAGIELSNEEYWLQILDYEYLFEEFRQHFEKLDDITSRIVYPENYGAKGDGVTDDTDAINQCLYDNPNSVIMFTAPTYAISNTINMRGNKGGQTLELNSSTIKWIGADTPNTLMLHMINDGIGTESRGVIRGGFFNGSCKVKDVILVEAFHPIIEDTKIMDFNGTGIIIDGYNLGVKSIQGQFSNILIMQGNASLLWSEGETIGIKVLTADSQYSNININRCGTSLYLKAHENGFSNCHFTSQFKNKDGEYPLCYGVQIDTYNVNAQHCDYFTNCYFDCNKYAVYNLVSSSQCQVHLVNCYYFYLDDQHNTTHADLAIIGGKSMYHHVDKLNVYPANNGYVRGYQPAGFSGFVQTCSSFTVCKTINHPREIDYLLANDLVGNESVLAWGTSTIPANKAQIIGQIAFNFTPIVAMSAIELLVCNRGYSYHRGVIKPTSGGLTVEENVNIGDTGKFRVFIDKQPFTITSEGRTVYLYNIYLAGDENETHSGNTTVKVNTFTEGYCNVYISTNRDSNTVDVSSLTNTAVEL